MKVKYLYYRCQNRSCTSPINVRAELLHEQFARFIRLQQPNPVFLKLFHSVITDVWNTRRADAVRLTRIFDQQLEEAKERKRKLLEAYIFHEKLTRAEYDEMRVPLEKEIVEKQSQLEASQSTELDLEAVVDFAENLLLNAAGVWQESSLDHKQRLQQVLFPNGVEYSKGVYRTPKTSLLFSGLEIGKLASKELGSATGNRTRV